MIGWLQENPIGIALASLCAALLLVSLLLFVVWSLPPPVRVGEVGEDEALMNSELPELAPSKPIDSYAIVTERPVFNESRQPELDADLAGETADDELIEEEVDAPEVELAGVVITPSLRMVTFKQKDKPESLVAFEGKPLEGDYGSWQVSRIGPREVMLTSASGRELQLELQVHDAKIAVPPKAPPATAGDSSEAAAGERDTDGEEPLSRAEEIRQRIAERREELRRAAEDGAANGASAAKQSQQQPPSYREAIRSMIGSRQEKQTDENNDR
ncbi:MAG: hypothetical protein RQ826_08890 [Xanthomonadales bacterium]|nr:hypothetical protein [Xanthomonadales bacterium]